MSRERLCRVCKGWHSVEAWPSECRDHYAQHLGKQRSSLPTPFFRRDHMDPLWHPLDKRTYDSRSDYDAVTKANPQYEEVGDQMPTAAQIDIDRTIKDDVGKAYQMVQQGYKPSLETAETNGEGWV